MDGSMDGKVDDWMYKQMEGWMDRRTDEWQTDKWAVRWWSDDSIHENFCFSQLFRVFT